MRSQERISFFASANNKSHNLFTVTREQLEGKNHLNVEMI